MISSGREPSEPVDAVPVNTANAVAAANAELPFLDLLIQDASAVDYDRPIAEAVADGADAARLAQLERARTLALRVRSTLREQRRREQELAALFETAGDLAGLRELDEVLQAIAVRARKLLNTDVAYLTLNDPQVGDTYMRVTAGSVSARFQRVRLGLGEGLGGLVAQTGSPYVTADYFNDDRFHHTRAIDSSVHEEGLVAILGVPLLVNARIIGVLFAADRHQRPFSRDEIALLGSLATHAALAIEAANRLAETDAALAALAEANRTIQAHSASVERASEAHEALTGLLLRGADVAELAASVAEVLGGTVIVTDGFGRELCGHLDPDERAQVAEVLSGAVAGRGWTATSAHGPDTYAPAGPAEQTARTGGRRLGEGGPGATAHESERSGGRAVAVGGLWVAEAGTGAERIGALVVRGRAELEPVDQRILERAATVTALRLLTERSVRDAEHRVRGELLSDLIDASEHSDRDSESLRERARRLSADLDVPHVMVVAQATDASRRSLASAASHLAATRRGLAGERGATAVLLLPGSDPAAVARDVARQLQGTIQRPVTAGATGPVLGPAAVAESYAEADRCLSALLALGRVGETASARDLGFVGLLLSRNDPRDTQISRFVHATIGPVLDYDARRSTDLVGTLDAYFSCGANLGRAKDLLHVHVNTVTQRLDRVAQLLGADWNSPERVLEIQLALRLHRLRS
jgi:GAF domain-containing protein/sugar diacid utilization regulator